MGTTDNSIYQSRCLVITAKSRPSFKNRALKGKRLRIKLAKVEENQQNMVGCFEVSAKSIDFETAKTLTFYLNGTNPGRIDNDT